MSDLRRKGIRKTWYLSDWAYSNLNGPLNSRCAGPGSAYQFKFVTKYVTRSLPPGPPPLCTYLLQPPNNERRIHGPIKRPKRTLTTSFGPIWSVFSCWFFFGCSQYINMHQPSLRHQPPLPLPITNTNTTVPPHHLAITGPPPTTSTSASNDDRDGDDHHLHCSSLGPT